MNYNLKDKKIMVTGASGGIGKAICKKFIEENSILIFTFSNNDKLNDLKKEFGSDHFYYELDLTDQVTISEKVKKIANDHKDIHTLINNAGITNDNLLLRMKESDWQEVINVNLNSNYYIIKEIIPQMIKNRNGNIIGISSVIAFTGNPGQSNYSATKSGMISMYKSLALEVAARNIRINIIAPGFVKTAMTDKLSEDQVNAILAKIPINKLGSPSDIANVAVFLTSDQANYITGQTFHVNGGMLMV